MEKPRIFLGSSGKQQKLLQALTRVNTRTSGVYLRANRVDMDIWTEGTNGNAPS